MFNYDDRLENSSYSIQLEILGHKLNAAGRTHVSKSASAVTATTIVSDRNFVFVAFPLCWHMMNIWIKQVEINRKILLFPVFQKPCVPGSLSTVGIQEAFKTPKPKNVFPRCFFPDVVQYLEGSENRLQRPSQPNKDGVILSELQLLSPYHGWVRSLISNISLSLILKSSLKP